MAKIQETKGRFFITLRRSLVLAKGWKKGTELEELFNERGNIELLEPKSKVSI